MPLRACAEQNHLGFSDGGIMDIEKWLEKEIMKDLERPFKTVTNKNGLICEPNDPSLEINKGSNVFHMEYYRRT
jgi:hypothetical protein